MDSSWPILPSYFVGEKGQSQVKGHQVSPTKIID